MNSVNFGFNGRIPAWLVQDYLGKFANPFSKAFLTLSSYHEVSRSLVTKGLIFVHVKNLLSEINAEANTQRIINSIWTINSLVLELLFPLPHAFMTSFVEMRRLLVKIETNQGSRVKNLCLYILHGVYCSTFLAKAVKVSCLPHHELISIVCRTFENLLNRSFALIPFDLLQIAASYASLPRSSSDMDVWEMLRGASVEIGRLGQAFGKEISKNPLLLFMGVMFLVGAYNRALSKPEALPVQPVAQDPWVGVIGCEAVKQRVDSLIWMVQNPAQFVRLGAVIPNRVLFHGPHGSGMTMIASIAAKRLGFPLISVSSLNMNVRFASPSVFLVKGIDALPESALQQFYAQIEKFPPGIIVIATAYSSPGESIRRGFPEAVRFSLPTEADRTAYFQRTPQTRPCAADLDWTQVVTQTENRSYKDLCTLMDFAARNAGMRDQSQLDQESIAAGLAELNALMASSHRAVVPRVTLEDVVGCERAKARIECVVDMLRNPARYLDLGARVSRGFLFYGAPGSGKTKIAEAMAHALGYRFLKVSATDLIKKYIGESGQSVHQIFREAEECAPCVLFIDEVDAIARGRGVSTCPGGIENARIVDAFLTAIEQVSARVPVVAATNYPPRELDPAFVRPGRFDELIEFTDPTDRERAAYFVYARTRRHRCREEINWDSLRDRTDGWSYAKLESLMNFAAVNAGRRSLTELDQESIDAAYALRS